MTLAQQTLANLGAYKDGVYVLPDLPYEYGALGEAYNDQTLQFHHDKHHAAYVKGLNAALEKLAAARRTTTTPTSRPSPRPSRSTAAGTCCTRCSGTR